MNKDKINKLLALKVLGWNQCNYPTANIGEYAPPDKLNEPPPHVIPNYIENDGSALKALQELLLYDKKLRASFKMGFINTTQSMYYMCVIKKVEKDKLLLYNGDGKTMVEAITNAMLRLSQIDWKNYE